MLSSKRENINIILRSKKDKVRKGVSMARLSDIIEAFIKELIENNDDTELQIQRNELANYFSCAPSQINYVLTTRFTKDRGYYIESKRGGGGCIIIRRVQFSQNKSLSQIINDKIGENITYDSALKIIEGLYESSIIDLREAKIMKIAVNDRTLSDCLEKRNKVRANILKSILMVVI